MSPSLASAVSVTLMAFVLTAGSVAGGQLPDPHDLLARDITPPNTTITSGPQGEHPPGASATFAWTGTDDRTLVGKLTFAYRLSPLETRFSAFSLARTATYNGLPRGQYTLFVKSRDGAGNEDPTPAERVLIVGDVVPPSTSITSGPTGAFPVTSATFTWTGSDVRSATPALTYASRLHPIESAFSPFGAATARGYENLPNGTYTFYVKARDEAGNEDPAPAVRSFVVALADDPLIASQWHLGPRSTLEAAGINARGAWAQSSGFGIVVGIVDDGLEHDHPDLDPNYVSGLSWDFNDGDADPSPSGDDSHGTGVAGIVAARGSNTRGVSGVAPFAGLAGLRLIAAPVGDEREAEALGFNAQDIAVSSNSWGPLDDGTTLGAPGPLAQAAIQHAIETGRGGLGRVFVWAAGNGRHPWGDSCSFDGYATQRYAMAVGALASDGSPAFYSEACPALFISAPSGGHPALSQRTGLTTTDLLGTRGGSEDDYRNDFNGTSGAAPIVSGVAALMLERNPSLTWRDVQYILAQTAVRVNRDGGGWTTGAYAHSESYGFGLVDARAAVDRAARWANVPPEQAGAAVTRQFAVPIPDDSITSVSDSITISASADFLVEHVEVEFDATHTYRGDLELTLTSPSGVVSTLAPVRITDSAADFRSWVFRSVRHWGEPANGNWTLTVTDRFPDYGGIWNRWTLRLYGRSAGHLTIQGVSPAIGGGASQVFALRYGDTAGGVDIKGAWVWFNATFASSAANSCLAYYDPVPNRVFLLNDAGTLWHSATLGEAAVLENSQCAIALGSSFAGPATAALGLNLAMTFKASFGGPKNVFMFASSQNGAATGWVPQGIWTVPGPVVSAEWVGPADGIGVTQTFTMRYSDSLGADDVSTAWVWFNETFASTSARSCLAYYDRSTNTLRLINDAGSAWSAAALGSRGILQNSQCAIALEGSFVESSGTELTLTLDITFKAPFAGPKNIYMFAASRTGQHNSDWQIRGAWTIPPFPAALVTSHAVTPNAGSGASQAFAMQYSDTLGAADLGTVWVWFNATFAPTAARSCLAYYEPPTNTLHLINDDGTGWLAAPLGGSGTLQNSQCAIELGSSKATSSGTALTLTLAMTFKPGFSGAKTVFMFASSVGGNSSGWQTRGTWTAP